MLHILMSDIVPIIVVMAMGYIGAKRNAFTPEMTQGFDRLVLNFALPAALFVSITKATREMLIGDLALTSVSLLGLVGLFVLCQRLSMKIFKNSLAQGTVTALSAGAPTIGFLGFAVFEPIWGDGVEVGLVVGIVSIIANAILIPIGFFFLNKAGVTKGKSSGALDALISAVRQPVVWVPLSGVALVLAGIRWPASLDPSLDLIAKANSGVAVFAAGLALASVPFSLSAEVLWNTFYRMLLSPFLMLLAGFAFGLRNEVLTMFVVACSLPPAFSGLIISSRYNIFVKTTASSTAVSTLIFALTAPFWLWSVPYFQKILLLLF